MLRRIFETGQLGIQIKNFNLKNFNPAIFALAIISVTVIACLHELSHFAVANLVSFHAPVIRIGRGQPELSLFKNATTEIKLGPLPIGGSVEIIELNQSASGKEAWLFELKKIAVLLAGPAMNFLIAFALGLYITADNLKPNVTKCIRLCQQNIIEIAKALIAIFLFRNQSHSRTDDFNYYTFLQLPIRVAENFHSMISILFTVSMTEAIFNLLPIPAVDGGKILFALCAICNLQIGEEYRILAAVFSSLLIIIMVGAAVFRSFDFPFPKVTA